MNYFYIITPSEATLITKFMYGEYLEFDPFVGEQVDGNFIVEEIMYNLLKDTEQFGRVDWAGKTLVPQDELHFKES
jgi:hypothetical protein